MTADLPNHVTGVAPRRYCWERPHSSYDCKKKEYRLCGDGPETLEWKWLCSAIVFKRAVLPDLNSSDSAAYDKFSYLALCKLNTQDTPTRTNEFIVLLSASQSKRKQFVWIIHSNREVVSKFGLQFIYIMNPSIQGRWKKSKGIL